MKIEFIIPLQPIIRKKKLFPLIVSEANKSEHWSLSSARHKIQKKKVKDWMFIYTHCKGKPALPCIITLTRIAPRMLDEEDNLPYSLKWFKDAVADFLIPGLAAGRADDSKSLKWFFKQEKGKVNEYALKVEIQSAMDLFVEETQKLGI